MFARALRGFSFLMTFIAVLAVAAIPAIWGLGQILKYRVRSQGLDPANYGMVEKWIVDLYLIWMHYNWKFLPPIVLIVVFALAVRALSKHVSSVAVSRSA